MDHHSCGYDGTTKKLIVNWVHPIFLKTRYEYSKEDKPNQNQAINNPFADEYQQATCTDLETLECMGDWNDVDCDDEMNVVRLTWYFKLKQYPYGLMKYFKDRYCAHGDMQP